MTYDEFIGTYEPKPNQIDTNAAFDGFMFETYGPEVEHVWTVDPAYVWTILDVDGVSYLSSGRHYVNRLGYMIATQPVVGDECHEINLED